MDWSRSILRCAGESVAVGTQAPRIAIWSFARIPWSQYKRYLRMRCSSILPLHSANSIASIHNDEKRKGWKRRQTPPHAFRNLSRGLEGCLFTWTHSRTPRKAHNRTMQEGVPIRRCIFVAVLQGCLERARNKTLCPLLPQSLLVGYRKRFTALPP